MGVVAIGLDVFDGGGGGGGGIGMQVEQNGMQLQVTGLNIIVFGQIIETLLGHLHSHMFGSNTCAGEQLSLLMEQSHVQVCKLKLAKPKHFVRLRHRQVHSCSLKTKSGDSSVQFGRCGGQWFELPIATASTTYKK